MKAIGNQPWNLVPLDAEAAAGLTDAGMGVKQGYARLSNLVHGNELRNGMRFGLAQHFKYAIPSWAQFAIFGIPGNIARAGEAVNGCGN